MCTVALPPAARSAGPNSSSWFPGGPLIENPFAGPWIAQVTPAPEPAGSRSVTCAPFAVPGPELLTVTVNPIGSPAFTVAASADLVRWIWLGLHVINACAESEPSLVVVTLAVLS